MRIGADFLLPRIPLVDAEGGHAQGFPVFQADGIHQPELLGLLGVHQRVTGGEHATGGMAEQRGLLNAKFFQQLMGVEGQLLEAVLVVVGLAGAAETDLVRCDHPITGVAQGLDGAFPGGAAKVLAMHQYHAAPVGLTFGRYVHVAHLKGFALGLEVEMFQGIGVLEALQLRAIAGGERGGDAGRQQAGDAKDAG